jgi:UDP-N-acetylmuramoyl-L-alanyl-D-glutamate--2,6-diaminopimelate ligase
LSVAKRGDTVVIAGKGHEAYQQVGNKTFPFDDAAVAREELNELNAGRNN